MNNFNRKEHWENIYLNKQPDEVSWYQPVPRTSLDMIEKFRLPANAAIIDIGGGDSYLAESLLDMGYTDLTVLDISEAAVERAKKRLGERAAMVTWIIADVATFVPDRSYDLWHDRAAFHFFTGEQEIKAYIQKAERNLKPEGVMVIGTFSEKGPTKCSGIEITQYSEASMTERFSEQFEKIDCFTVDHSTPFNTMQNFVFCSFRKLQ